MLICNKDHSIKIDAMETSYEQLIDLLHSEKKLTIEAEDEAEKARITPNSIEAMQAGIMVNCKYDVVIIHDVPDIIKLEVLP